MIATRIYRILAILILAALAAQNYATGHKTGGVERYQERIRAAAAQVPAQIGPWVGEDVKVPVQALSVLKPNVMISRRYLNIENGATAGLLLVHCGDAHHMVGHFPLRCYPAQGWAVRGSHRRDWTIGAVHIPGMEYEFYRDSLRDGPGGGEQKIIVANCLLRPDGKILRNMEEMQATIVGAGGSASGAAQIQVYFDAAVPLEQRNAAIVSLLKGYLPVINAVIANLGN
ncbi:MAG TPA: exosortase-associated EpsI family protein [Tepidisphaeraceae bacterium]|nr:exosortase-associated EpsI family protein [Tepidisphaeraceae bacterium]